MELKYIVLLTVWHNDCFNPLTTNNSFSSHFLSKEHFFSRRLCKPTELQNRNSGDWLLPIWVKHQKNSLELDKKKNTISRVADWVLMKQTTWDYLKQTWNAILIFELKQILPLIRTSDNPFYEATISNFIMLKGAFFKKRKEILNEKC